MSISEGGSMKGSLRASPCAPVGVSEPSADEAGWQWYCSHDDENFQGPYDTRDEAVSVGRENWSGEAFSIIEARKRDLRRYLPGPDQFIDEILERACDDDQFGDDTADLIGDQDRVAAAKTALRAALAKWWDDHGAIFPDAWAFSETRNATWLPALAAKATHPTPAPRGEDGTGGES
jgi:hypothetical protein